MFLGAEDQFVGPVSVGCLPLSGGQLPQLLISPLSMGWVQQKDKKAKLLWGGISKKKRKQVQSNETAPCMCQVYHADLSGSLGKLNLSLNRSGWALGLAWLTVACVTGFGGPVDWVDKPTWIF